MLCTRKVDLNETAARKAYMIKYKMYQKRADITLMQKD